MSDKTWPQHAKRVAIGFALMPIVPVIMVLAFVAWMAYIIGETACEIWARTPAPTTPEEGAGRE